jgi:chemosensory pili system protein ChpA (sensor histidine kinase/response regulator)
MQTNAAKMGDVELAVEDLGPLAWVLDELRKSLDSATKALRRFVRDAELARGSDLAELDASQLRIARQQLHQAVGALEMVGLAAPAKVLRAMEALAQKFVQRPELCSDDAAIKVERAGFALTEYLEGVLKGRTASAVALFPQYRNVLELVGGERVHPADLWPLAWRWNDVVLPLSTAPLAYGSAVRARMDLAVLKVVKTGEAASAAVLRDISLGFAAAQPALESRVLWTIYAAFFEALAHRRVKADVYVKRTASRVLTQYASLARGDQSVSDRLAQDLLFFCAQAELEKPLLTPVLTAVLEAYGLTQSRLLDYDKAQFGRFDPALLVQARKRIAAATETWSALAGGDTNRLKAVLDQFAAVSESLVKLHPESSELARALTRAVEATVRSGESPSIPVAMEVATSVLFLDATYEDLDPTDSTMAERSTRLAQRLDHVGVGGQPEAFESWMEQLYRRVSDRQTMGSVVAELRTTLGDIEKSLDQFFRSPQDKTPLHEVPSQLAQMRGVFSVLGLDQASLAALRMRASVENILVDEVAEDATRTGVFEKLGNSLGAMGFLIDMLSYQRALAKKLFVYDESLGEFKPLMGRERVEAQIVDADETLAPDLQAVDQEAETLPRAIPTASPPDAGPMVVQVVPATPLAASDDEDAELRDIFLEEAREVIQSGLQAVSLLADNRSDLGIQTTLRRAFHTLKGSSRMVGLNAFGEAAWSFEQLLNTWLAEQKPATDELIGLSTEAIHAFGRWVEDIVMDADSSWSASAFRDAADALRIEQKRIPLQVPEAQAQPVLADAVQVAPSAEGVILEEAFELVVAQDVSDVTAEEAPPAHEPEQPDDELAYEFTEALGVVSLDDEEHDSEFQATQFHDVLGDGQVPAAPTVSEAASLDLDDFDFGVLAEPAHAEGVDAISAEIGMEPVELVPELLAPEMGVDTSASVEMVDEQVRVIGPLRIGIPLYNVYLNEADEWSRRLLTELSEWALELYRPISDSTIVLAHSLAGSSATVGFAALSQIARSLEHALAHVQLHGQGVPAHAAAFNDAAEDIRRLLHQFAAGFLRDAEPQILDDLQAILAFEFLDDSEQNLDALSELPEDREFAESAPIPEPESIPKSESEPTALAAEVEAEIEAEIESGLQLEAEELAEELAEKPAEIDVVVAPPVVEHLLVPPAATGFVAASVVDDDEIDAVDALDADLFPIFEEEALELLPLLGGALRQWAAHPERLKARSEALRVLHTLKGSARLAGAMHLGEMSHRLESAIERLGIEPLLASDIEPLLTRFDALSTWFEDLRVAPDQIISLPETSKAVDDELPSGATPVPALASVTPSMLAPSATAVLAPLKMVSGHTVRVRSQLLDRLLNQAGEVMITRSRLDARLGQLRSSLGELTGNLDRLRSQLRDIEVQSESQMQSRLALAKDTDQGFDPLEFDRFTRVQELTRMMAESVNDVATVQRSLQRTVEGTEDDLIAQARQARELQRDLLRTRMVEFEGISERLYGVVRQASKDVGKQVRLDITGGSLDMDRGVLDRMAPAFEHLLRNAVAHGIEDADVRRSAGKPAVGTIAIDVRQDSNAVTVTLSDDGAGLDLQRIRDKAIAHGLLPEGAASSDADVVNFIFSPGFSTADSVTELSGRGIGLDVVRAEVNALGGRIETTGEFGKGTQFKMVLPLTTAVTQVVMLRMGDLAVGVPANVIETIRRVSASEVAQAYVSGSFPHAGEQIPFFWFGTLLQASACSQESGSNHLAVAIFRSAGQRVAAHVDEVLGNQEVVVKNLGPQLSRLPGMTGMSVLASGAVALIYNPVALATVYGEQARQLSKTALHTATGTMAPGATLLPVTGVAKVPLVLVVDDSITVRRVTQRLLKREGYRVALAADGLQALEQLRIEKPALVLSDIEMPRMDGFDLARNIRGDAELRDLPIIMITSRIAEKHHDHASELGVDHYLGKPYPEDELMALVRHYCSVGVEA